MPGPLIPKHLACAEKVFLSHKFLETTCQTMFCCSCVAWLWSFCFTVSKHDLSKPLRMTERNKTWKKISVSSVWKKAEPSLLVPLWWEQPLTGFSSYINQNKEEQLEMSYQWSPPPQPRRALLLFYLSLTNMHTAIKKKEITTNENQMGTSGTAILGPFWFTLGVIRPNQQSHVCARPSELHVASSCLLCCWQVLELHLPAGANAGSPPFDSVNTASAGRFQHGCRLSGHLCPLRRVRVQQE